jgi:hypothetical protein
MQVKNLIVAGVAAACVGAVAYAAVPVRRPAAPVSRAVQLRSQYDPFALTRLPVVSNARATVQARVAIAAVRPPYRPETRSPYQPPTRGPYISAVAR